MEKEFFARENITVGSSKTCNLCIDSFPNKKITICLINNGWSINGLGEFTQMEAIPFEKVIVVDKYNSIAITVYESGSEYSSIIELEGRNSFTVGRNSNCDIVIGDKQVSGRHVEFTHNNGRWDFKDLGSSNGTYLNGKKANFGCVSGDDSLTIGFCKLIINNDKLFALCNGKVISNIKSQNKCKAISSMEEEYPYHFKQSPRLREELPDKMIELQSPPMIGGKPQISWLNVLLTPILTVGIMLLICLFVTGAMTMLYFSAPMTLIGVIMSVIRYRGEKKKHEKTVSLRIEKYDEYLSQIIEEIEQLYSDQKRILNAESPSAFQCISTAIKLDRTLWDRKYRDADFMNLRIGTGTIPASFSIKAPKKVLSLEEDELIERSLKIAQRYATIEDCPITVDLKEHPMCGIIGDRNKAISLGKNLIVQATEHHSYDDVRIVVICDADERKEWSFCRWLPHIYSDDKKVRYYADNERQAQKLLDQLNEVLSQRMMENRNSDYLVARTHRPYYLFICTSARLMNNKPIMQLLASCDRAIGAGAIFLFDRLDNLPKDCHYVVDLLRDKCVVYEKDNASSKQVFVIDKVSTDMYERYSRSLAPLRVEPSDRNTNLPTSISFLQGYNATTPRKLGLENNWGKLHPENSMSVPIGVSSDGMPFMFDIHEKHHGPHGLIAGMTGSGKSEMVQSWILSMAVHFSPSDVSFVLIDFKGTGLLLPFKNLPHLAGTISDLDTSIGRNLIALENELTRRKAILDKYRVSNITSYLKLYRQGKATEPLPYLFIIIDEFAEFKARFPDFMEVINRIFAIGRTLGVHILLLTQKPTNVVDDKMNANTRFRWCLKVANSADSRDMLHHSDAAKITTPGRAYVQVGEDEIFEEIQSYWSGAPYNPYRDLSLQRFTKVSIVDLYGNRSSYETEKTTGYRSEKNEIDAIVDYIDSYTRQNNIARAKAIWTSKLPNRISLKDLLTVAFDGEKWESTSDGVRPIVGILDDPRSQSQYPLYLDLVENGHTAVYGSAGSGKTTFLHTTIMSLALTYAPDKVNMYMMDFGGGSLNQFKNLPHVGGVAVSGDDEKIEKLSVFLSEELRRRRHSIAEAGMTNILAYNEVSESRLPYIILLIDNFAPIQEMYPELDSFFHELVRDGGSCGMYIVATATSPNAIGYRISQNIKFAIALRMTDKLDYAPIVGRTDGLEPENHPGRGLVRYAQTLEFQTALPSEEVSNLERVKNIRKLIDLMNDKCNGCRAAAIPVMPDIIKNEEYKSDKVFVGLSCKSISPCYIDLKEKQFVLFSSATDCKASFDALEAQAQEVLSADTVIAFNAASSKILDEATRFDDSIQALMSILQKRKDKYDLEKKLSEQEYPYILIVIKGLKQCFDNVNNETVRRLSSIITLGKGLNIAVMVFADAMEIGSLYNSGDSLTINLVKQSAAILEGDCAQKHGVFQTDLSYSDATKALLPGEAYMVTDASTTKIKLVSG